MLLRDVYAPEGGRATSPAYPYEKNGSTFHDITSCELRRRESSIAYSGVLRRMTDSSYLRTAVSHCALHDPVPPRFHLQNRERKKSICAENMALSLEREKKENSTRKFLFHVGAAENRGIEK